MIELTKYAFSILNQAELTLYRGCAEGLDPILLVSPVGENLAIESVKRLEHEYALRNTLTPYWAVQPLALSSYHNRVALVLNDPGGEPLDCFLGLPLEVPQFLAIAIPLTTACRHMHERGLVHRDIKPANVLVDSAGGGVRLTGFGIALRTPWEHQGFTAPEVIAGTLAYMAPEQTGRTNRSIDPRSDLYALGVTFYQMLTGALPFTATDPMELLHCHIARRPVPPHEQVKTVPDQISAIVMKLLSKTMEERYQTAAGVEDDLRQCLEAWQTCGRIDTFALGAQDASDRLRIPEKLYGRDREIDVLLSAFERVAAYGMPETVLVSGHPGIGKSSVVNELRKALIPSRGLFAAGKFDQYRRDIPYAPLAQAFQALVRTILGRPEAELAQWRIALEQALGPNGQLIVNLIPELGLIIGAQPTLPELPPQDDQNRFQTVFRRFVAVFARPEHPLVLFLDDLQWLDGATLELVLHLIAHEDTKHMLLIGAYRDNITRLIHPIAHALHALRAAGAPVHDVVMAPLGIDDVGQLIAEVLLCSEDRARPLAQLVSDKTGGNPFFTIQFVTELVEEKLITFDSHLIGWTWDLPRILDKGHTDNVLDLMAGKLRRLPDTTQQALKQLACLGNVADIATLVLLQDQTKETLHEELRGAVRAGLVLRSDDAYKFVHDRVQEAAYALVAEDQRAAMHLRIGRLLEARMSPQEISENVFDIVNQLNAGVTHILDSEERYRVAELNFIAGRKAKAATAYTSACHYLSVGMGLLGSAGWERCYGLAFDLWMEGAECEFLNGNFEKTESLIEQLIARARSNVDKAATHHLAIRLHVTKAEYRVAIERGLECLRLFGIVISPQPSREQAQIEFDEMWDKLDGRSIESLIDLPLMTDPEKQAVLRIFSALRGPAVFINSNLFYTLVCRAASISLAHGVSETSTHFYSGLAQILGPVFHRYEDGFQFATLARKLAEKHRFIGASSYFAMEVACVWARPIQTAVDYIRLAFRAAIETGDQSYACYSAFRLITDLLLQGAQLDDVFSESERSLEFTRQVKFQDAVDIIICQRSLIQNLRGVSTPQPGSEANKVDEEAFEARLTDDRMPTLVCWYWILKLQARFMSGDFEAARAAAQQAKERLWASEAFIQSVNFRYYDALTIAALYEGEGSENQLKQHEALHQHLDQLREWAEACPETFLDKYTLVLAEIARIERRDQEAMRLYEQSINQARNSGFIQNEAIANELAARFYEMRGFETVAYAYLKNSRHCYLRWGAVGKVRQLEQNYPQLRETSASPLLTSISGASIEQIDVAAVVKASQAVLGEIVLDKLIETLMTIAVEHAGAQRGVLVLLRGNTLQIEAEAETGPDRVEVLLRQADATPADLPESLLQTVMRTRESVILDDAQRSNPFMEDKYVRRRGPRSVLCLPLVKQTELIGIIYLENNLAPGIFTLRRIAVLELLASQAAISLENARLYADLVQENLERKRVEEALRASEASLAEGQRISRTGSWRWDVQTGLVEGSAENFRILGIDTAIEQPTYERYLASVHPEDRPLIEQVLAQASRDKTVFKYEYRIPMPDGSITHAQTTGHPSVNESGNLEFVGTIMDITERRYAEEALRDAQAELARASRLRMMGELAGSIVHEINQPLAAVVTNAEACLRWLNRDEPDLVEARDAISRLALDGQRAANVVKGLRALAQKSGLDLVDVDLNDAIREVLVLLRSELERAGIVLHLDLFRESRPVYGDRVQLQQVLLNLIRNGIEAMSDVTDRPRVLRICSKSSENDEAIISVEDVGTGLDTAMIDRIFDPLFTTKTSGMGMGLSICRSIVEAHRGRLRASSRLPHGAVFYFTVPFASPH